MIFYDGSTGSLGRSFASALTAHTTHGAALCARLEDNAAFAAELEWQASKDLPLGGRANGDGNGGDPVVHLVQMAARVPIPSCEADPAAAHHINVTQVRARVSRFVAWARQQRLTPRVLFVSSGHVYAAPAPGVRLNEASSTGPRSVYARSKLAAEETLQAFQQQEGFSLLIVRLFGLIAPVQPASYMLQGMLARAREGKLGHIPGLSYARDLLDARDVCTTLVRLSTVDWPADGVLNLCSGTPTHVRDVVAEVVRQLRPEVSASLLSELGEAPGRADDVPWIVGDPRRLELLLGGPVQRISLAQTIHDAINALPFVASDDDGQNA